MDREYIGFEATPAAWRLLGKGMLILLGISLGGVVACGQLWSDGDLPVAARQWAAGIGGTTIGAIAVTAAGLWFYASTVQKALEAQRPERAAALKIGVRYLVIDQWYKFSAIGALCLTGLLFMAPIMFGLAGVG